jgi:hypothetical protein
VNGSSSSSFLSGSQLWIGVGDRNQICSPQESNTRLVFDEVDSFKCSSVTLQSSSGVAVFPTDPMRLPYPAVNASLSGFTPSATWFPRTLLDLQQRSESSQRYYLGISDRLLRVPIAAFFSPGIPVVVWWITRTPMSDRILCTPSRPQR